MKKYNFTINGNKYDVEILQHEDDIIKMEVNGTLYEVQSDNKPTVPIAPRKPVAARTVSAQGAQQAPAATSGSAQVIEAPLPGNILTIMVKEGDRVTKGQKLLVYEAMKMENDVLSESDGVVSKLHVSVGDNVLQGDKLIEIK